MKIYILEYLASMTKWLITAAVSGVLPGGKMGVIRSWVTKKDVEQLTRYNAVLSGVKTMSEDTQKNLDKMKSSMSDTAKAAIEAANGGVVALDKLNKGFNWAALGAKALNIALNFGIAALLSLAVSAISDLIHRVERAHQATAAYKNQL